MEKTERLLDLVALLLDAREPVSFAELRDLFPDEYGGPRGAAERKLERDKAELLELGVPIEYIDPQRLDERELGGYRIPAGTLVMPAITAIHFREDLYPQPDEFRPERFLTQAPPPYTWIPFGGGVRRCIGAAFAQFEMRVVMRTILERVRLRPARPRRERSKLRAVTAAPRGGCRVVVDGFADVGGSESASMRPRSVVADRF